MVINFWYEFASTYSYPAAMRIQDVAEGKGVRVQWQPFLLGPIFKELGWTTSPFNLQPAKGRYMWRDMERICDELKLPFKRPNPFPQNGLHAARVAIALPNNGQRAEFTRRVYTAGFGLGQEIANKQFLTDILADMGHEAERIMTQAATRKIKTDLKRQVEIADSLGVFGAPTFITTDGELFWGNDRLEDALSWEQSRQK